MLTLDYDDRLSSAYIDTTRRFIRLNVSLKKFISLLLHNVTLWTIYPVWMYMRSSFLGYTTFFTVKNRGKG